MGFWRPMPASGQVDQAAHGLARVDGIKQYGLQPCHGVDRLHAACRWQTIAATHVAVHQFQVGCAKWSGDAQLRQGRLQLPPYHGSLRVDFTHDVDPHDLHGKVQGQHSGLHASMCPAAARGENNMRHGNAHVFRLLRQFPGTFDIPQVADGAGATHGHCVGPLSLFLQVVADRGELLGHIGATGVAPHGCTQQGVEHHIAAMLVRGCVDINLVFQQCHARKTQFRGGGSSLPHMVRLQRPHGHYHRCFLGESVTEEEFEFASLVAAGGQPGAIVAFHIQARTAEPFG